MSPRFVLASFLLVATSAVNAAAPVTVSPGSVDAVEVSGSACPTFNWGYRGMAETLFIEVYRDATADAVLTQSLPGTATGWTPPLARCLDPAGTYRWRIRAEDSEWSAMSYFRVASAPVSSSSAKGTIPTAQLEVNGGVVGTTFAGDGSGLVNVDATTLDGVNGTGFTASNQACAAGNYVSGVDGTGNIVCAPLASYVNQSCYLYFGWRDQCDSCTSAPTKWGRVSGASCQVGQGMDNTCQSSVLDTVTVTTFGLNPDGAVDSTDKFYVGLRCF